MKGSILVLGALLVLRVVGAETENWPLVAAEGKGAPTALERKLVARE